MRRAQSCQLLIVLSILPVLALWHRLAPQLMTIGSSEKWSAGIRLPDSDLRRTDEKVGQAALQPEQPEVRLLGDLEVPYIVSNYSTSEQYASSICSPSGNENLIVIWVYTAPSNIDKRNKIRSSWGSVKRHNGTDIRTVFFVGAVKSAALQKDLLSEQAVHHDIVQDTSYVDAYRNLTRKGISAMYWIATHCPKTLRVVKVDDDTLVNPYNLVTFIRTSKPDTLEKFICKITQTAKPIRRSRSKYYVSFREFSEEFYPLYCQGYGYMIPPSAIPRILQGVKNNSLLTMEDVYITGVLGEYAGVSHHSLTPSYATTYVTSTEDLLKKILLRKEILFIGHSKSLLHYDMFWKIILERRQQT